MFLIAAMRSQCGKYHTSLLGIALERALQSRPRFGNHTGDKENHMDAFSFKTSATGAMTTVDTASVNALEAGLKGALLTPCSPGYDEARTVWNAMIDRRPGL